ncbi:hypothetical protein DXG03_004969 [Asterophora parasitica]|uniref:Probable RNA polymerase II nuclear localization protein SLC7A6OS n=1 Tax=Asterophora parasitica TaxID=117018 RepID=A0A9P7GFJ6_9AGAR|nr:hypothetical protein DXG03_004969 [Asterophora parasitica]
MEVETGSSAPQSYTILRIKRKRNEEPLDALGRLSGIGRLAALTSSAPVVESRVRRKKSRGGIGLFQFAQTVENDVWGDEKRAQDIQDQISRLARESSTIPIEPPPTSVLGTASSALPKPKDETRHYTILNPNDADAENVRPPRPTQPPKVISSKDLPPKTKSDIKMFDAILTVDKEAPTAVDAEMDKFLPMLNDYLKCTFSDLCPKTVITVHDFELNPAPAVSQTLGDSDSQPDDYVWDVFYHRPVTLSEWNAAANVGTLSGLPPSITDPYDSESESEEEDEADEDSNAEEYYKNDYPEEDDSSSSGMSRSLLTQQTCSQTVCQTSFTKVQIMRI